MSRRDPTTWKEADRWASAAGLRDDETYDRMFERSEIPRLFDVSVEEGDESGPVLVCRSGAQPCEPLVVTDMTGLLPAFAKLAEAEPERVAKFANHWGVMGFCEHGFPQSRPFTVVAHSHSPKCKPTLREPVEQWKQVARSARAIMAIAVNLHRGREGRPEDWEVIYEGLRPKHLLTWDELIQAKEHWEAREWQKLQSVLDYWLDLGGVRPRVKWDLYLPRGEWGLHVELGADGLFPNIARQLVFTCARHDGVALCRGCSDPYALLHGNQKFCPTCRDKKVPQKLAMREYRRRQASRAAN